jgi:hypothetical protein
MASGDRTYGDQVNQRAVQRATPGSPGRPATPVPPGSLGPLDAPSERPDEPLTAGLPIGPGDGPPGGLANVNEDLWRLRAIAQAYPSRELNRLIAIAESRL